MFVILTTRANALTTPIHHRMQVILNDSRLNEWMSVDAVPGSLRGMLIPAPTDWLVAPTGFAIGQ